MRGSFDVSLDGPAQPSKKVKNMTKTLGMVNRFFIGSIPFSN
jgi:hypothetical protein